MRTSTRRNYLAARMARRTSSLFYTGERASGVRRPALGVGKNPGAPSLSLRSLEGQGGEFDLLRMTERLARVNTPTLFRKERERRVGHPARF
jgi:hypothetical protein